MPDASSPQDIDGDSRLPYGNDSVPNGLKEISNLAKFIVSSHKQGCGIDELRSDDLKKYWQYVHQGGCSVPSSS